MLYKFLQLFFTTFFRLFFRVRIQGVNHRIGVDLIKERRLGGVELPDVVHRVGGGIAGGALVCPGPARGGAGGLVCGFGGHDDYGPAGAHGPAGRFGLAGGAGTGLGRT